MIEHDDEGYTSPSKEGEEGIQAAVVDHHSCLNLVEELATRQSNASSDVRGSARCSIPWDKIALLPESVVPKHITWDDIKYPFPYKSCNYGTGGPNRVNLESKVYLSDEVATSNDIIDKLWVLSVDSAGQRHLSKTAQDLIVRHLTPTYITINQFIDHALHLMCGRESQSFTLKYKVDPVPGASARSSNSTDNSIELLFVNTPNVMVHGISPVTLKGFCVPFLECGSSFKRLSYIRSSEEPNIQTRTRRNSANRIQQLSKRNAVFQAFTSFISNYLRLYETVIMIKKESLKTMTQLRALVKPLRYQLCVLEQIVESHVNGNAVELLTALNNLLFSVEDFVVVNMIKNLFISCASAYLRYIADWIFRGELGSSMEFHITRNPKSYEDRRFWTKQFSQKDTVPLFLKDSVEKIFETGKALNLLTALQPLISLKTSSLLITSLDEQIKAELGFEQLKVLGDTWTMKLATFYSENAHLVTEIQDVIQETISNFSGTFDTEKFATERANFHRRKEQVKLDAFLQGKDKKQDLLHSLQHQIKLSNQTRLQKQMMDRMEDQKIQEYLATLDQGGVEGTKGFAKNYFPRSATVSALDVCDGVATVSTTRISIPPSKSEPHCIVNHCGDGNGKQLQSDRGGQEITPARPSQNTESTTKNVPTQSESRKEAAEKEIRFNPDKIITRDPQPYAFSPIPAFVMPTPTHSALVELEQRRNRTQHDQFCMNEFLACSVSIPLYAQNKMVNSVLLHYIIKEKMLFRHLEMINKFLCLQNGVFSHFLSELLIDEVKKSALISPKDIHEKSYRVTTILSEALAIALDNDDNELADPMLKNLNFMFADDLKRIPMDQVDTSSKASSRFQVLNYLRLTYTVEWPINIILTEDMMTLYENVFSFLMKLIRAELLLERMFCHLKSKSSKSRQLFQLNNFRFRMLHFVRSVRSYVNITVIHTAWNDLCSTLHELDSIEKIYLHLVAHVKSITSNCLLGQKAEKIMKLILSHLIVVESFCSQLDTILQNTANGGINWDQGEEIDKQQFLELSQKYKVSEQYAKLFTESVLKVSTRRAYNKVDNFLEHYNFNDFFHPFQSTSL